MPKPIRLYTSSQPAARAFAELLADNLPQPVLVHELDELPAPDPLRRQRLRTELGVLRQQLDTVLYLLTVGESEPRRYEQELTLLRQDRTRIEGLMAEVEQQMKAAGLAVAPQEGGEPR